MKKIPEAVKMLSDGYTKSDICVAVGCTIGELDRMLKASPENLRKSFHDRTVRLGAYDEATSGIIIRAMTSGDDDRIGRLCRALGKSKHELMNLILGA